MKFQMIVLLVSMAAVLCTTAAVGVVILKQKIQDAKGVKALQSFLED